MRKAASLRPSLRIRFMARPHTGLWNQRYARYPGSRLRSGNPAAQIAVRLVLLGSPPDTVHGATLRGTDPSSLLTGVRRHNADPGAGIHPCCSGLQVQGTANSPTSAALPRTGRISAVRWKAVFDIIHHFRPFINITFQFFSKTSLHPVELCYNTGVLKQHDLSYGPVAQLGAQRVRFSATSIISYCFILLFRFWNC